MSSTVSSAVAASGIGWFNWFRHLSKDYEGRGDRPPVRDEFRVRQLPLSIDGETEFRFPKEFDSLKLRPFVGGRSSFQGHTLKQNL